MSSLSLQLQRGAFMNKQRSTDTVESNDSSHLAGIEYQRFEEGSYQQLGMIVEEGYDESKFSVAPVEAMNTSPQGL